MSSLLADHRFSLIKKMCFSKNHLLLQFWADHPALFYGTSFLLGLFAFLNPSFICAIPCCALWLPFGLSLIKKEWHLFFPFLLSLFLFLTGGTYLLTTLSFPHLPDEGVSGVAEVKIRSIHSQQSWFGHRWLYRCELTSFFTPSTSSSLVSSLPCSILLRSENGQRPLANQDYRVTGKLIQTNEKTYRLKISSKAIWTPIPDSNSWAECRYQWKTSLLKWIQTRFSDQSTASFLAGLITGHFEEELIRQQFARFGLLHLLAISGFHFAVIAGFLNVGLSPFFRPSIRMGILLFTLSLYQIFLGPQASILRAWIMSSLGFLGHLIHKPATSLNSLGFALMFILGYNPLLIQELAFQLSFSITAAILLFYDPMQKGFLSLFPKKSLSEVIQMNFWNQSGYCVLSFLRQGLSLTLAVNLLAFPLTLYYFHQFPWMSLLYNLFFPLLASLSLCLLILGSLFSLVPFIGHLIDLLNDSYTCFLLRLTNHVPLELDLYLNWETLSVSSLICYLTILFLSGIWWHQSQKNKKQKEFFSI